MIKQSELDYAAVATKLSAVLGRKWDVTIIFGASPATDGSKIYLPHWDFADPALRAPLYGLIAHEAGGHIKQTDFPALSSAILSRKSSPQFHAWKSLQNILEDIRIEANLMREYPGAVTYLNAAVDYMLCREPSDPRSITSFWNLALNWCLITFRYERLGQTALHSQAEAYDRYFSEVVSKECLSHARDIASKVSKLGPSKVEFTLVMQYADQLVALFENNLPSSSQSDQQGADGASGDQSGQQGADGASGDQSGQQGADGASGDQSGQQGADGASGDQSGQQGADGASGNQSGGYYLSEVPLKAPIGDIFADLADLGANPNMQIDRDQVYGFVESAEDQCYESSRVASMMRKSVGKKQKLSAALSPLLCGDIEYSDNRTTGNRINSRRIVRALTDKEPAIFRKIILEDDQSVAVQLLIDRSASTKDGCLSKEIESALGLTLALEQFPNVETAISYFPSKLQQPGPRNALIGAPIIKRFDQPVTQTLQKWPVAFGGTPLGIAYAGALNNFFLAQKERKILIVLTDGQPSDPVAAEAMKLVLEKAGVEIYGIIISGKPYPDALFSDSERIIDPEQLPAALFKLVKRIL